MKSKSISLIVTAFLFFVAVIVLDHAGGYLPAAYGSKTKKKGAASTQVKSDLPFIIDCSRIDPAKQAACNSYIAATRDRVYPTLRYMTGTDLSRCYDAVYYTIITGDPGKGYFGLTLQNRITLNQGYSVDDDKHAYDFHELIHTMAYCSGALDEGHVFHGALSNAVISRLGVQEPGYFFTKESAVENIKSTIKNLMRPDELSFSRKCQGILADQMTILYSDLGEEAIKHLYQITIKPTHSKKPNKKLTRVWGQSANHQVQALLETLRQEYKYKFSVPACGY